MQANAKRHSIEILIIDDDHDYLNLLAAHLDHIPGVAIRKAYSPEEAVSILCHEEFSLIVCDWDIAAKTAPEVFEIADPLARQQRRKVPVLFMSGSEKIAATQRFIKMRNFEAVSFMLKRLGPPLITIMAENILERFDGARDRECVYLT